MADTPIPVDDSPPPDDDLRRLAIPVDTPQEAPAVSVAQSRAIPVGSPAELESRVRPPMARPLPATATTATPPGSTEDLENKSLQTFEHPATASLPLKSGIASLWSKAENVHNPALRTLAEIGAGGAKAIDVASQVAGKVGPAIR